jgi:hypothetical protein
MPRLVRDLEALLDPRRVFFQPEDLLAYMTMQYVHWAKKTGVPK